MDQNQITEIVKLSTWDLIKMGIHKLVKERVKLPAVLDLPPVPPPNAEINHLAVILDGRVEEVIHTQNRLAALLLSEPTFVEFFEDGPLPKIGWEYKNGVFVPPEEQGHEHDHA